MEHITRGTPSSSTCRTAHTELKAFSSARLPFTIAKAEPDYPARVDYTISLSTLQLNYSEGLFIDYRHFDAVSTELSAPGLTHLTLSFIRRI